MLPSVALERSVWTTSISQCINHQHREFAVHITSRNITSFPVTTVFRKQDMYSFIPLEKNVVVYKIIMAVTLQFIDSITFLVNAVSHMLYRSMCYASNFVIMGCHMTQEKNPLVLSRWFKFVLFLAAAFETRCILIHRIVMVLQFHNS